MYYLFLFIGCVECFIPLKNIELGNCGKMDVDLENFNEQSEHEHELEEDYNYDEDSRIVGGFDAPDPVPWFAMLKIMTQNGSFQGYQCGGTLITSRLLFHYLDYIFKKEDNSSNHTHTKKNSTVFFLVLGTF